MLVRRDVAPPGVGGADPDAVQLGDLLAQRSCRPDQVGDPVRRPAAPGSRQGSTVRLRSRRSRAGRGALVDWRTTSSVGERDVDVDRSRSPRIRRTSSCIASVAQLAGSAGRSVVSGGCAERRLGDVVEADHRQVVAAPRAPGRRPTLDRRDAPRCRWRRRSAVGRSGGGRAAGARRLGRGRRVVVADQHERLVDRHAGRGQRLAVALLAQLRRTPGRAGRSASRSAGGRASSRCSVASSRAAQVVRVDRRHARRAGVRVDRDDRRAVVDVDDRRGDQHRAVDQRAAQPREVAPLPARRGRRPRPPAE